jgi:small basic protein (TIGR04137 family)
LPLAAVFGLVLLHGRGKGEEAMSQHPSFGSRGKIRAKKSVLRRYDRIELLKKKGKWKEGDSVFGLPKTKPE